MSVRLKLTLSYAGFLMIAGALLMGVVWVFLLRYVPDQLELRLGSRLHTGVFPVRSNLLREFAPRAAVALAGLLAFGLAGGWWLAGRMLAPLTRITEATRTAAGGSLSHRIALEGRNDEFRELADAFDAMLGRLEAHVAEQGRFAANVSHELRTPLATTKTLLEVARSDPERSTPLLIEQLEAMNGRAIDLTEAMLLLSRAERRSFAREAVDLSLLAEQAVETYLPMAEERGIQLTSSGEAAPTIGSRALLLQLATNLVHNAIVHNQSSGGRVRIETGASEDLVTLTVENTGAELAPGLVATLTEPFQRGAGRVRGHDSGVGLGLAIVASVAEAHDGLLTIAARDGGGMRVVVQLPARGRGAVS
ncbi:MAG: histidine kinase [Thermoleophilia bacterium]|nr:histidine kinase [Thermoleophilia bacterium]